MKTKFIWMVGAALLPAASFAQFDFGGGATTSKPWEEFKLTSKTKVKLAFRDSKIDNILAWYQQISGISIVKDPSLVGTLTLTSAKPVGLNDAFNILNQTLSLKNFEMSKEDNILVIRAKQDRGGFGGRGGGGFDPSMFQNMGSGAKIKTYTIQYANASQLARVINEVFAGNQDPFSQMMQQFAQMGAQGGRFGNNQGGRQGRFGQNGGGFGNNFGGFGQRGGANGQSNVKASADDFSNSVIVNAPDKEQGDVERLIKSIDKPITAPQTTQVFKLDYAVAQDLVPVVQNVLTTNAPQGRGGAAPNSQAPLGQLFQTAFRTGSTQSAFGQVVAEPRTNSLVVTATKDNLEIVSKTVKELDKDIKVESTTFVFPLANARADVVAGLLQQAFGTRQGLNGGARNTNTTGRINGSGTNGTTNGRSTGNRNNTGLGGIGQIQNGDLTAQNIPTLPIEMQDPNAMSGELMTSIAAQGFGGFGGGFGQGGFGVRVGGQGGQSTTSSTQTGRDSQGRLINVRDLTGQVTAIPDTNTNSIIVVASPDAAQTIRGILDQLDKIPEQVMIETIIVEATLDATDRFGVEWKYVNGTTLGANGSNGTSQSNFGLQNSTPPLQGFSYTLAGPNLSMFLNAIKTDSKFQVLSTPRIFTSNNAQAQINISQSIPYILSSRQDVNGNFTYNYAFQDVGIVLTVTPRITTNGYVTLDVTQTANDLQGYTSFNAPIVNQRIADTTVTVKDTETIILGGIIRSTVTATTNKIPLLGDIPILGNLFKSSNKEGHKTELLVLMTPRIVRNAEDAHKLREETQRQLSPGSLDTVKKVVPPVIKGAGPSSNGGN